MSPLIRQSVQKLEHDYVNGDKAPLERLVRAFRKLQDLPPDNPDSFFNIAGFHGEPYNKGGSEKGPYWGGYCFHENVLFPTWHRAYLLRLEKALQTVIQNSTFSLPFWDECVDELKPTTVPTIFTTPTFRLPEDDASEPEKKNPLYSYTLQQAINDPKNRYTKSKGYSTVRYPLSGLVATKDDQEATAFHNSKYADPKQNAVILSNNVSQWLAGTVNIPVDDSNTRRPDTYSLYGRFKSCLTAPNYTIFSNTTSQTEYNKDPNNNPIYSLESPHNGMHLALGGFYQAGEYNADPIKDANGDMGDNETAGFDPIFFFHHCFIDYAFWVWQKKNGFTTDFDIDEKDPGSILNVDMPGINANTSLTMNTPLNPFTKADSEFYTSYDMINIKDLGYDYAVGSLDPVSPPQEPRISPIIRTKRVHNINRADYAGSFVIRTYAVDPKTGWEIEVGREPILSRWSVESCENCQNRLDVESLVPLDEALLSYLGGVEDDNAVQYKVRIHTHEGLISFDDAPGNPRFGEI